MATTVTAAQVKAFAPAFAAVADAIVTQWITWAPTHLSESKLGDDFDQAVMLWVCHQLQTTKGSAAGAGGPVTAMEVGDVSVQYATPGVEASTTYKATAWGRTLMLLLRQYTAGPRMV